MKTRTRTQWRLTWTRETDEGSTWSKSKKFWSRPALDRWVGLLTTDRPWEFLSEFIGKGPDDPACECWRWHDDGDRCEKCGKTVRQVCAERSENMWPLLGYTIESRTVTTTEWGGMIRWEAGT